MSRAGTSSGITPGRVILGLVGVAIFVLLIRVGGSRLLESLRSASPGWLAAAFATIVLLTAVTAHRWGVLTDLFLDRDGPGFGSYYRSYLLGRVLALVMPSGLADLAGRPVLHRWIDGTPVAATARSGVLARVVDVSLVVPLVGLSLASLLLGVPAAVFLGSFALLLAAWLVAYVRFTGRVAESMSAAIASLERRLGRWPRLGELAVSARKALRVAAGERRRLEAVGLMSAGRYLLIAVEYFCLARALGLPAIGWTEILVGIPLAQSLAAVAVTPAGLGLQEGGFWGALRILGVPSAAAGSFLLGWRLLHTGFVLALAGGVTLITGVRSARR